MLSSIHLRVTMNGANASAARVPKGQSRHPPFTQSKHSYCTGISPCGLCSVQRAPSVFEDISPAPERRT